MNNAMDQLQNFLYTLLHALVRVRINAYSIDDVFVLSDYGEVDGRISLARDLGLITMAQSHLLHRLLSNAMRHGGKDFPGMPLRGPVMPIWIARERAELAAVKPQARVPANDEQVSAPAPRRQLRLLCLLVPSRTGSRALPVHTLRPMPPRVSCQGRWNLEGDTGFYLRETHATAPAPEVFERYSRLGQSNALRSYPRTVRAGELSQ